MQPLTPEQQAQRDLHVIKLALDAAVKGSVFTTMDDTFAICNAFNNIAATIKAHFNNGTTGSELSQ